MIRQATKYDIDKIIEMLKNYRDASDLDHIKEANDRDYVVGLLSNVLVGMGVVFIAEDTEPQGMLIAINIANIWNPKVKELNELAYWVEPKYRGGTVGYRLIKSYIDYAELKKAQGAIQKYTISKMFNSPDLKYHKFGFSKLEEKWIK